MAGELTRVRHALERVRATLHGVELALKDAERGIPPGSEAGQALATGTLEVATGLAKVDALMRARDAAPLRRD